MLKTACSAFVTLIICLMVALVARAEDYGNLNKVIYLWNYDGDSITFDLPTMHPIVGIEMKIRVAGIDTPEMRGKCVKEKALAVRAGNFVQNKLLRARKIRLKNMQRGKYFRIVADVIVDDENLGELLIQEGLAVPYDGGTKTKDWCK